MTASVFGSFASGFGLGMNIANKYQEASDKADIREVSNTKRETSDGYTADDGVQLDAIANAKDADGKPYYELGANEDGSYDVKPTFQTADGKSEAVKFDKHLVTDYLGMRKGGIVSDEQFNSDKTNRIADIVSRSDPAAGMAMRRQAGADARADRMIAREDAEFKKKDKVAAAGQAIAADVSAKMNKRLTGEDGKTRTPTADDMLASHLDSIAGYFAAGMPSEAGQAMKDYSAALAVKISSETEQRKVATSDAISAASMGNYKPAEAFYNKFMPDGMEASISSDDSGRIVVDRVNREGVKQKPFVFENNEQLIAALNSGNDPKALYNQTVNEMLRQYKVDSAQAKLNKDSGLDVAGKSTGKAIKPAPSVSDEARSIIVEASKNADGASKLLPAQAMEAQSNADFISTNNPGNEGLTAPIIADIAMKIAQDPTAVKPQLDQNTGDLIGVYRDPRIKEPVAVHQFPERRLTPEDIQSFRPQAEEMIDGLGGTPEMSAMLRAAAFDPSKRFDVRGAMIRQTEVFAKQSLAKKGEYLSDGQVQNMAVERVDVAMKKVDQMLAAYRKYGEPPKAAKPTGQGQRDSVRTPAKGPSAVERMKYAPGIATMGIDPSDLE